MKKYIALNVSWVASVYFLHFMALLFALLLILIAMLTYSWSALAF